MIGLTVVEKPVATVRTSSPAFERPRAELRARKAAQGDEVGARPAVDEHRATGADVFRERPLEQGVEASGGQPAVERRVDEGREILAVEDLPGDRNGGLARDELALRERSDGETSHRVKDRLPLKVRGRDTPRALRLQTPWQV